MIFTNDGFGNEIHNLTSTGDFTIQDDSTTVWTFDDTGHLTFDPTSTGTLLDFELATQWTGGTVINADFASATTQASAISGVNLDYSTNVTVPNSAAGNQTGINLLLKDGGASATTKGIMIDGTMDTGLVIGSGTNAITTGINLDSTGITNDIILQNGEGINNETNGTVQITTGTFQAINAATNIIVASTTTMSLNLSSVDETERLCHGGGDAFRGLADIADCAVAGEDYAEYF